MWENSPKRVAILNKYIYMVSHRVRMSHAFILLIFPTWYHREFHVNFHFCFTIGALDCVRQFNNIAWYSPTTFNFTIRNFQRILFLFLPSCPMTPTLRIPLGRPLNRPWPKRETGGPIKWFYLNGIFLRNFPKPQ